MLTTFWPQAASSEASDATAASSAAASDSVLAAEPTAEVAAASESGRDSSFAVWLGDELLGGSGGRDSVVCMCGGSSVTARSAGRTAGGDHGRPEGPQRRADQRAAAAAQCPVITGPLAGDTGEAGIQHWRTLTG